MTEPLNIEQLKFSARRVRFTGRDFYTMVDDLIALCQQQFGDAYNDFVSSDIGVMLIECVAWAGETLSFGQDHYSTEAFLATARSRRAVNRICRQLGYKMSAAPSASTDLEVNLSQVWGFNIPITSGFQFQGPGDLVFEATQTVTFLAGEGPTSPSRTVSVREGETTSQTVKATGNKSQKVRLTPRAGRFVADGTVTVTVAGSPWAESEFLTYEATDQFEVDYNADPPLVAFGDGVAGNIPSAGDDIVITYVQNSGKAGNIGSGAIEDVVDALVVAFQTIGLIIEQPTVTSGGDDRELLERARRNAPEYFAARGVAVTRDDYLSTAQSFTDPVSGAVAVAQAYVATSAEDDIELQDLLTAVRSTTTSLEAAVLAQTALIDADADDIDDAVADATVDAAAIQAAETAIDGARGVAATEVSSGRAQQNVIDGDAAGADAIVVGIGSGAGPSALTAADYAALRAYMAAIQAATVTARAAMTAAIAQLGIIEDRVDAIAAARAGIEADLVTITGEAASIRAEALAIETAVSGTFDVAIDGYCDDIFDHVDSFLSLPCSANLVTVPILTVDSDGFYAPPSTALVRALQARLDERREVSQVPNVVSGESSLLAAVIVGRIGVLSGYVQATVVSQCEEVVNGLLRGRSYGDDLILSDLTTSTVPDPTTGVGGIEGVKWAVYEITGPAAWVDSSGNLIAGDDEVITKGSVTLTPEDA